VNKTINQDDDLHVYRCIVFTDRCGDITRMRSFDVVLERDFGLDCPSKFDVKVNKYREQVSVKWFDSIKDQEKHNCNFTPRNNFIWSIDQKAAWYEIHTSDSYYESL
jgi:hypothetical protein